MRRAASLFASLAVVAATVVASAAPTIWERAKDPKRSAALLDDAVHKEAATLYTKATLLDPLDPFAKAERLQFLSGARSILEGHGAATSKDPRLRYDLGLVLGRLGKSAEAVPVLEGAVALAPDHALAEQGWFELGLAYAHLGRHADEERAYLSALPRTERAFAKAIVYSNLAESRMQQGKLDGALEAAESAIELDGENVAAQWNRAVILDRLGDAYASLEAARRAIAADPTLDYVDGDDVFFEPEYEREWYHALASLARAEDRVGDERKKLLLEALVSYRMWLDAAPKDQRYRARAEEDVAVLEKRLGLKKK